MTSTRRFSRWFLVVALGAFTQIVKNGIFAIQILPPDRIILQVLEEVFGNLLANIYLQPISTTKLLKIAPIPVYQRSK